MKNPQESFLSKKPHIPPGFTHLFAQYSFSERHFTGDVERGK